MKYVLNSAVITAPGTYTYKLISLEEMKEWLNGEWVSTIGYEATAKALEALTGIEIPVDRKIIKMQPGDEALVFRLVFPPGTKRINPKDKGSLSVDFVLNNCEIGILKRIK